MKTSPDDIRAGLAEAGSRRAEAETARQKAMADIEQLIARGQKAGLTVTEMADLSGVSRPTVYAALNATR